MSTISKNSVAKVNYKLTVDGSEVEASNLTYLHGHQNIIEGLEKELAGLKVGDKKTVHVKSADAYGDFQEDLIQKFSRSDFPPDQEVKVGMQFQTNTPQGVAVFEVKEITGEEVTMDGNHPMAGKDLSFEIEILEIREATKEELAHGHVHGPDGHHH
ncbi:MAG: peptidylprolyl isomerase [Leptospiraceae bacterium]|nr:peptidylprolyl isomerase [Leptospiraceae bacterium]